MASTATGALPLSDTEILYLRVLIPASGTNLTTGVEGGHSHHGAFIPPRLIFQHSEEVPPASITDLMGQLMVAHHPLDIEVFDCDHLVFANESSAQFLVMVVTPVRNALMDPGNLDLLLLPIV